MSRPKKPRFIQQKVKITSFKPVGSPTGAKEMVLNQEEVESLRLADLEGLSQEAAARLMKISRSTFQRVLKKARIKTAQTLVKGLALNIKGGDYQMTPRFFGQGRGLGRGPSTGSGRGRGRGPGTTSGSGRGRMGGQFAAGPGGYCLCVNPECKHKIAHQVGTPCYQQKCPKCGSPMIRE